MSKYMTLDEAIAIAKKLSQDPNVEYADPNGWVSVGPIISPTNPVPPPPITVTTGV